MIMGDREMMKGDKVILKGVTFHAYHGVLQEEKTLGQKFTVDVDAWMDLRSAGISDKLTDTVSYTDIYSIIGEVLKGPSHNLLESVAESIASRTLTKYAEISAIRVKVKKPHVAVVGSLDYLGVEIIRYRGPVFVVIASPAYPPVANQNDEEVNIINRSKVGLSSKKQEACHSISKDGLNS